MSMHYGNHLSNKVDDELYFNDEGWEEENQWELREGQDQE